MPKIPSLASTLSEQERMAQRLQQREWAQAASEQLSRLHGASELRAAVLALEVKSVVAPEAVETAESAEQTSGADIDELAAENEELESNVVQLTQMLQQKE